MLRTISPQVTAQPAAGMNAQAPAPITASTPVTAAKAPQSHMWECFICLSFQGLLARLVGAPAYASVAGTGPWRHWPGDRFPYKALLLVRREIALHQYGSAITELVYELVNDHCQEYPPGTPPLPETEVGRLSDAVPGWERDAAGYLTREFAFDDFIGAFGLVARVALLAQAESHHPRVELEWGRAAFTTWTQTAAGLTRNDFILAAKIDQLAGT
jgi:4a-hydroxytetrahydrobiopterin dehydratase